MELLQKITITRCNRALAEKGSFTIQDQDLTRPLFEILIDWTFKKPILIVVK